MVKTAGMTIVACRNDEGRFSFSSRHVIGRNRRSNRGDFGRLRKEFSCGGFAVGLGTPISVRTGKRARGEKGRARGLGNQGGRVEPGLDLRSEPA